MGLVAKNRLGWAVVGTANQPKSQILYHEKVSPHDSYLKTLHTNAVAKNNVAYDKQLKMKRGT